MSKDHRIIDRLRDLVGSFESGVSDLGTRHREHLQARLRRAPRETGADPPAGTDRFQATERDLREPPRHDDVTAEIDDSVADPTLIHAMLALTPEQRLERLQAHVDSLWELGLGDSTRLR